MNKECRDFLNEVRMELYAMDVITYRDTYGMKVYMAYGGGNVYQWRVNPLLDGDVNIVVHEFRKKYGILGC